MTSGLATLVRTGLVCGVIVAALLYPLTAIAGLGAKSGAETLSTPIDALQLTPAAQASHLYAADGTTKIAQFFEEYRSPSTIGEIAPIVAQAVVAAEDGRFYEHNGVDLKGVVRAFVANRQAGEVSQGASTLTMQYVRNVLRDSADTPAEVQAATEQTGTRKVREAKLALQLEQRLSKTEILERYLNVAYFGHRAYGITAAAEVYFSKKPADLTLPEAALLAGLVQAPSAYDPASSNPTAAVDRRDYVIDRLAELQYIDATMAAVAKATPLELKQSEPANDCAGVNPQHVDWGYFCDFFRSWWMSQAAFGASPGERLNRLRRGGYSIVTSLDPALQADVQRKIVARESVHSQFALGLVAVEPRSGRVRTMGVNRVYSLDRSANGPHSDRALRSKMRGNYPNTVNPLLGGGDLPGYQAGSTFKMFTMLSALEKGMPLDTEIYSPRRYQSIFKSDPSDRTRCGNNRWCPQNASASMTGRQSMWTGFGKSVNTFFVQLEQRTTVPDAVAMAERLGITWHTDIDRQQASPAKSKTWGAFTLGVADTTPLEMANAYATVAADGTYCEPLPVTSITDVDGKPATWTPKQGEPAVEIAAPRCRQAIPTEVARGALDAARCVTGYKAATGDCGSWSTAPKVHATVGRPVAGKTGTTDNNRAAWFIGMTPALTTASFIADPDNPFHQVGSGANHAKPMLTSAEFLRDALAPTPYLDFSAPAPLTAYGADGKNSTSRARGRGRDSGSDSGSRSRTNRRRD